MSDLNDPSAEGPGAGPAAGALTPEAVAAQLVALTPTLEAIVADRALMAALDDDARARFLVAAGQVSRPDKRAVRALGRARRKASQQSVKAADEAALAQTGIRRLRASPVFQTPRLTGDARPALAGPDAAREAYLLGDEPGEGIEGATGPELNAPRTCYVCRTPYTRLHGFYDQLCVACGDLNFAKRSPQGDLRGRVALVTGARVKIGYQAAIMLLRSGAQVVVLTRFPKDAARRYAAESDFADWRERLVIHGIDLRHIPSVERLCDHLVATLPRLDFLINNACQTVRRPPGFYGHLMALELGDAPLPAEAQRLIGHAPGPAEGEAGLAVAEAPAAMLSQVALVAGDGAHGAEVFRAGELDADEQQVDRRETNSWRLKLADVPTVELVEVQIVNAVAPFVLNARLKPLMQRVTTRDAQIVNVSAMEGQFYRLFKTDRHPHTNMAKAALNMMTRTSASDYLADGIHMNSVDTGWVTDEDPIAHAERKVSVHGFHPPLDIVDGAARIVDPVFEGVAGRLVWGQFLKDYRPTDW